MTDWTAPNLDTMSIADLSTFVNDAMLLTEYAQIKIKAKQARGVENIPLAERHERRCERLHALIPQRIRW
jgi:glutamate synthase domain-containing protein 2